MHGKLLIEQRKFWDKRIARLIFELFIFLILLEIGLRIGGFIYLSFQEYLNYLSLKQKGTYRIMCLGECTTALGGKDSYPTQLEKILNERNIGVKFSVINLGIPGTNTTFIVSQLEDNLNRYKPDMVIAMMGINDRKDIVPYEDASPKKNKLFLQKFNTYKLTRLIWLYIKNKTSKIGICKLREKEGFIAKAKDLMQLDTLKEPEKMSKKPTEITPKNNKESPPELKAWFWFREEPRKAEESLKKAIELNPKNDILHLILGIFYSVQGNYDKAEEMLKKAIELNPRDNCQIYFTLGMCYRSQGKYDQAEEMFKEAIKINPSYDRAYFELGRRYMNLGEYDKAEGLLKEAIKINPENGNIYSCLALCYGEQGKYKLAKKYFKIAARLRSENYNSVTPYNYQSLREIVTQRGVKLVCVQFPMFSIELLKKIFDDREGIIFVDNEKIFKEALKNSNYNYEEYFMDSFAGDFGYCTPKSNGILAENIANAILKEYFNK